MRVKTLQVVWHEREPVCSLDFSKSGVLATGGADKSIKVNQDAEGNPGIRFLANHRGLNHTVNVLRFSPCGELLASGGDGGEVVVWKAPVEGAVPQAAAAGNLDGGDEEEGGSETERWRIAASLRGHRDDVLDLSWSPDASALVTGSIENMCLVWDVDARKAMIRLDDHSHYVQGVAWDPVGHYIVSQSTDRTCKVYCPRAPPPPAAAKKAAAAAAAVAAAAAAAASSCPFAVSASGIRDLVLQSTLSKRTIVSNATVTVDPLLSSLQKGPAAASLTPEAAATAAAPAPAPAPGLTSPPTGAPPPDTTPVTAPRPAVPPPSSSAAASGPPPPPPATVSRHGLFHDEGMASFFRRLSWSPDGSFLAVPAGMYKADGAAPSAANVTYIFARGDWSSPIVALPSGLKPVVAVRFSPLLYRPAGDCTASVLPDLQYRMVLAVATMDSVMLYETETFSLLAVLGGLHLAAITDLAWAPDALTLAASSRDGFCSLAVFSPGELGMPYSKPVPTGGVNAGTKGPEASPLPSSTPSSADDRPPALAAAVAGSAAAGHRRQRAKSDAAIAAQQAPLTAPAPLPTTATAPSLSSAPSAAAPGLSHGGSGPVRGGSSSVAPPSTAVPLPSAPISIPAATASKPADLGAATAAADALPAASVAVPQTSRRIAPQPLSNSGEAAGTAQAIPVLSSVGTGCSPNKGTTAVGSGPGGAATGEGAPPLPPAPAAARRIAPTPVGPTPPQQQSTETTQPPPAPQPVLAQVTPSDPPMTAAADSSVPPPEGNPADTERDEAAGVRTSSRLTQAVRPLSIAAMAARAGVEAAAAAAAAAAQVLAGGVKRAVGDCVDCDNATEVGDLQQPTAGGGSSKRSRAE